MAAAAVVVAAVTVAAVKVAATAAAVKVAKVIKRVSKACHDDVLYTRVEKASAAIFSKAGCKIGAARNTTDPVWITAFCERSQPLGCTPHSTGPALF